MTHKAISARLKGATRLPPSLATVCHHCFYDIRRLSNTAIAKQREALQGFVWSRRRAEMSRPTTHSRVRN